VKQNDRRYKPTSSTSARTIAKASTGTTNVASRRHTETTDRTRNRRNRQRTRRNEKRRRRNPNLQIHRFTPNKNGKTKNHHRTKRTKRTPKHTTQRTNQTRRTRTNTNERPTNPTATRPEPCFAATTNRKLPTTLGENIGRNRAAHAFPRTKRNHLHLGGKSSPRPHHVKGSFTKNLSIRHNC